MTKEQLLTKIKQKVGNMDLDFIISICSEDGKERYNFEANGDKKHLQRVLNDLENGYKFYTF